MNRALVFWLAVLLLFAGGFAVWLGSRGLASRRLMAGSSVVSEDEAGAETDSTEKLTAFTLTNQLGREFNSEDLDGKVWAGSFFFSRCPQMCVAQNAQVARLQQDYSEKGLQLISITVDPKYDQPHKLAGYSQRFNANPEHWQFLTGDLDYIRRIAADIFQVAVEEETHSDRVIVFDRQGKVRGAFRSTKPEQFQQMTQLIDQLLAETTEGSAAEVTPVAAAGESVDDQEHS